MPIVALALVVLIGATALAVDLSLQTHTRRSLQNVSDAAALAGASVLPGDVTGKQAKAQQAAFDAVESNLGLPSSWPGATPGASTCASVGYCWTVSGYAFAGTTYTVTVNTPPQQTANPNLKCTGSSGPTAKCKHYVEVVIQASSSGNNPISGFLGFGQGTEGATSIAYHPGSGVKFGFALYANTITTGNGNLGEIVNGNVYANRYVAPQSSGLAGFCASPYPNPSGAGTLPGYVFLGAPQKLESGYANDGQWDNGGPNAKTITYTPTCTGTSAGTVNQTGLVPSCPNNVPGVDTTALQYNPGTLTCEFTPSLSAPSFDGPTDSTFGSGNCVAGSYCFKQVPSGEIWTNNPRVPGSDVIALPTTPGLYEVQAGCVSSGGRGRGGGSCSDLTIDVSGPITPAPSLNNITLYLKPGAIVTIQGQNTLSWSPYNALASGVNTGNQNDNGFYAIYAEPSGPLDNPATTTPSTLNINGGGNSAQTEVDVAQGSVIMPGGTINMTSNGWLHLAGGQALAYTWFEQGGNHPNDIIDYNAAGAPSEPEVLQLVQ